MTRVTWTASRGISWNSVKINRISQTEYTQEVQEAKEIGEVLCNENVNGVHLIDNGETIAAYSDSDDLVYILNEVQKCYHRSLAASDGIHTDCVPTLEYNFDK